MSVGFDKAKFFRIFNKEKVGYLGCGISIEYPDLNVAVARIYFGIIFVKTIYIQLLSEEIIFTFNCRSRNGIKQKISPEIHLPLLLDYICQSILSAH